MHIYLIRHGQTDWNVEWKLQGTTDTELNAEGLMQAKRASEMMKNIELDLIFSSPLKRAYVTAKTIADPHNLSVVCDDRLIEMCFGKYEGTTPELAQIDSNRDKLFSSPCDYVPPDEKAESFETLTKRCRSFLDDLVKIQGADKILVVSHGALIKGIQRVMFDEPLSKFWETPPLPNCEPVHVEYSDGRFIWR